MNLTRQTGKRHAIYRRTLVWLGWWAVAVGSVMLFAAANDRVSSWCTAVGALLCAAGLAVLAVFAIATLYLVEQTLCEMEEQYEADDAALSAGSAEEIVHSRLKRLTVRARDDARKEYSALILEKQAELSSLQSQINPHFLYNTLEAICGKAILEDVPDVASMAEALAGMFRYSISPRGEMASLEDELRNIQNYMLIQQYRFNNRFVLQLHKECSEKCMLRTLPRMTLQPIVENAIYHGLETKMGEGCITIDVEETDRRLLITVHDNGVGMDEKQLARLNRRLRGEDAAGEMETQHGGIALVNVNRRLQLCFGSQYCLHIYSTPGVGTDVEIALPAGEEDEKRNASAGRCGGQ